MNWCQGRLRQLCLVSMNVVVGPQRGSMLPTAFVRLWHQCVTASGYSPLHLLDQPLQTMSKVLVAIKRVIDYNARVRVKPDKASLLPYEAHGLQLSWTAVAVDMCAVGAQLASFFALADWNRLKQRQDEHEPILRDSSRGKPSGQTSSCFRSLNAGLVHGVWIFLWKRPRLLACQLQTPSSCYGIEGTIMLPCASMWSRVP